MCATSVMKLSGFAACTTSGLRLEPTGRSRSWFGLPVVRHGDLYSLGAPKVVVSGSGYWI